MKDQLGEHEEREGLLLLHQYLRRCFHGRVGIALDALSRGHFSDQALRLRKNEII